MTHNQIRAFSAGAAAHMILGDVPKEDNAFPAYREAATEGKFKPSVEASVSFMAGWNGANV